MKRFGLIGYPLGHSFSKNYFTEKFKKEGRNDCVFENFEIAHVSELKQIVQQDAELVGLSVTIPHKVSVMPLLHSINETARQMGAVNCIKIVRKEGKAELHGYNTDAWGFELDIKPLLLPHHRHALILGTGGSSKAVSFVLRKLGIEYSFVSRHASLSQYSYADLNRDTMKAFEVIVNCTPVGMYPDVTGFPPIPYEFLTSQHLLFDLVYNPIKTIFSEKGEERGAVAYNGFGMLFFQAENAWEIWNS